MLWWTCHLTACLPAPGVYQHIAGLCPGSWGRWQSGLEVIRISLPASGNPSGRGWKGGEGLGSSFPGRVPRLDDAVVTHETPQCLAHPACLVLTKGA